MTHTYRIAAILALGALPLIGCSSPAGMSGAEKKSGEVVATVGKGAITVEDFEAKLNEQSPFIRARYNSLERKKEFLDNLIRFEILAQEAERRGLDKDPEIQATVKKVMVQKLIRAEFDESEAGKDVPEADLKKFYDEHIEDYVKPERVRVSHVFLAADGAARTKMKSEAARLLAEVRAKEANTDKTAFLEAAKARSEDTVTKAAGGDLSFKTREELTALWGDKFATSAMNLKTIGEIGDLIETEKGFHLVKLTGRQNAINRPFDQARAQILSRLSREKRTQSFDDFVAGLKMKANVQVKEDVLAKIEVPASVEGDAAPAMNLPAGAPPSAAGPHGAMQLQAPGRAMPMPMPMPVNAAGQKPIVVPPTPEKK